MFGKKIKAADLKVLLEGNPKLKDFVIDVRDKEEVYDGNRILATKNVDANELMKNPQKYLKKDQKYYIICQTGSMSKMVTMALRTKKFDVYNVKGGMNKYLNE